MKGAIGPRKPSSVATGQKPYSTRSHGQQRRQSKVPHLNLPTHGPPWQEEQEEEEQQAIEQDWDLLSASPFATATIQSGPMRQAVLDTPAPTDPRASELLGLPPNFIPPPA